MEAKKQVATMIANTGVVFFAGTTVAYFLNPGKYSPIIAIYGLVFWATCFIFVMLLTQKRI